MRHRRQRLVSAVVAAGLAALGVAAPASAAGPRRTLLSNSKSPAAAQSPSTGPAAGSTPMNFEVDLTLADQKGAAAFAQSVSTPGSADDRDYLTPAQWEARYAPTPSSVNEVTSFLTQNGFTVNSVSADRMAIEASGTAGQVEKAFGTALSYHEVDHRSLLLADTNLSVPSSVAGVIRGVTGVSDTLATPDTDTGAPTTSATNTAQPPAGLRTAPPCGTYYGQAIDTTLPQFPGYAADPPWAVCGYTPPQLRGAYDLADADADDGTGRTVAVVDAYASPTLLSDAQRYAAQNDPSHPLLGNQFAETDAKSFNKGKACGGKGGWWEEASLDVEAVHVTAPGANILFGGAKNCTTTQLNKALRRIVDNHLADVITNSYGDAAGDALDSAADRQSTDNILLMAAGTGVSVLFSSGDDGDEFTTEGVVAADYPASSPYATAVGGTTLEIGAGDQRTGEYGWSTARSFFCDANSAALGGCTQSQVGTWLPIDPALDGGSGGGTSIVYPQPSYQQGVVPTALAEANGSSPMRVEPDISMDADPGTGMLVGVTQTFPDGTYYDQFRIGGTSQSSPLLAGVVARADEAAGGPLGFLNPQLYSLSGTSALYDVGPSPGQIESRADFASSVDDSQGTIYSTRVIDYEGPETYCDATTGACSTRDSTAVNTAPGYDNMTGLGAPGTGFVQALAANGG